MKPRRCPSKNVKVKISKKCAPSVHQMTMQKEGKGKEGIGCTYGNMNRSQDHWGLKKESMKQN